MTVDVLLPGSGSGVAEDTDAVLAMLSDTSEPTFPRSRMISDAPAARVPSSRVPLQGRKVAPPSAEYTAPRIEEGTASLSATLCASDGPRLETVTVKRMGSPAVTGSGAAVFVTDTSADIAASTSTVEMLLLGSGSEASLLTTAVLKMMPEAEGDSVPALLRALDEKADCRSIVRDHDDFILAPDGTNAHFIDPTIDISDEIECGPRLGEDLLEAEDDSGAFKLLLETEDDLVALEECRYMISRPICLCAENADLLEKGLRVFPGLALYDGTWEQPDEVVHYWERKYGLVRL